MDKTTEQIKADAEANMHSAIEWMMGDEEITTDSLVSAYIAGATAENERNESIRLQLEAQNANVEILLAQKNDLIERAQKLVEALEAVKRLKELWLYTAKVSPEHEGEVQALSAMSLQIETALQQWKGEKGNEWQPISTAPKDGRTIEVSYDAEYKETCLACWSNNPICMLGPRNGSFPPGWATPAEADCDTNLPLDPPLFWREWEGGRCGEPNKISQMVN